MPIIQVRTNGITKFVSITAEVRPLNDFCRGMYTLSFPALFVYLVAQKHEQKKES